MGNFENAKVKVEQGWLQGYNEGALKIFKGIPYAAPPVGALRFRQPQDPGRWRGVRKAVQYSAAAIQQVMEMPEMPANVHGVPQMLAPSQYEEDCLYLNVWSPAKTAEDKLPVFIWVHGGGMVAGSGCEVVCDGTGFASRRDVIVVTINYRLGFFGFFAHPDLTAEIDRKLRAELFAPKDLTAEEKQLFFHANAEAFYRFHDLPEMPYIHHMAE